MKRVISIDLGGTSVKAALVDQHAQIIRRLTLPTDLKGRDALLQQLAHVCHELRGEEQVDGIGIGTPGFVDSDTGKVLLATNLPGWTGTDVKTYLQSVLDLPLVVENDANVAAVGEAWVGAGRDLASFFMITLGTGVGGAIYDRQHGLWSGANFRGGEVGHAILYPGGKLCACGQQGCVEQYLSGRALAVDYQAASGRQLECSEIFAAAAAGEPLARAAVAEFCYNLSILLTSLQNVFDPAGFIIGGGLVHLRQSWWSELQRSTQIQCVHGREVYLLPATTGNDAGIFGAAYLALSLLER